MPVLARALAACAILAVFAAGPGFAAPTVLNAKVTSFGAAHALTSSELSSLTALASATHDAGPLVLPGAFASSLALSPTLALDSGYRLDMSSRFTGFGGKASPLLSAGTSFLSLADGGRYAGVTYAPVSALSARIGVSAWNSRLDNVTFDTAAATGLPFAQDRSSVTSFLAGVNWNPADWVSLGVNAISTFRRNTPMAYGPASPLGEQARTNALEVTARFSLGDDWVTTTHFAQGVTQLNQRTGFSGSIDSQAYSITVAKHGVFGDDAVGFSLSRPAPGMIGSFAAFGATGELPPMMLAPVRNAAPETDLQLGYVTSFFGGRLALQANAGYQLNPQGQNGASAVSVLSRAKIKF